MSDEYETYPLTMAHPSFRPAKSLPIPGTERRDAMGNVVGCDYQGTAEQFPPVTVNSEQEQEYYKAQGYAPAGKIDPSAYARQFTSAPSPDYEPVLYPKWVGHVLCHTAEDEEALTGKPAPAKPAPETAGTPPQTVSGGDELQALKDEIARLQAQLLEPKPQASPSERAKKACETRRANKAA